MKVLTPAQKAQFDRDGFLIYGQILADAELAELRERIDALAAGEGPEAEKIGIRLEAEAQQGGLATVARRDKVWQLTNVARHDARIAQHARSQRILDVIEDLFGTEDIKLFSDQTLMKPAYHGSPVSWHQDSAYWTTVPANVISCWTALDDVTIDNGCVKMVPGSQKHGIVEHRSETFKHAQGFDENDAIPVLIPAGSCSFHHSLTIHGSGSNNTPNRRRGLVTSYIRADAEWLGDPAKQPDMPLMRGHAHPGRV